MPKPHRLLVAVADGEHARFLRKSDGASLYEEVSLDSNAAGRRSSDLGADSPGAAFHSRSSAHHTRRPRTDLHTTEKTKFAGQIAGRLNDAMARDPFDDLIIIAPSDTLNVIQHRLDATTAPRVVAVLEKDLVKTPLVEIWLHVQRLERLECGPARRR